MSGVWLFNEHQAASVLQKLVARGVVSPSGQKEIVAYLKSPEMGEYVMSVTPPDPPKTPMTMRLPVADPAVEAAEGIGDLKGAKR